MIKIFAEGDDLEVIESWKETNGISTSISPVSDASELNITTFPCVLECDGTTVIKMYGEEVRGILDIQPADLAELVSKSN
jgi:hypothetical protein